MKLDAFLNQLENTRIKFEVEDFETIPEDLRAKILLQMLIDFVGNKKIEDKINEIAF